MRSQAATMLLLLGGLGGPLAVGGARPGQVSFDVIFDSGIAGTSY